MLCGRHHRSAPAVETTFTFFTTSMSTDQQRANARAPKESRPQNDRLVVEVLKLLPQRVRERFCYVLLALVLIVAVVGMYQAPLPTAAGTAGIGVLSWLARVLGR
jgi:hypothetical protein